MMYATSVDMWCTIIIISLQRIPNNQEATYAAYQPMKINQ
jgi:hypothetical protein